MCIKELKRCRICGNTDLQSVVNLGVQGLSGVFPEQGEPDPLKAPLELVKCVGDHTCGLVQLRHSVPLDMLYGKSYGYRSGVNQTMTKHLQYIVSSIQTLLPLKKGEVVLDIGSNDGTLLKSYSVDGLQRIGIDPSGKKFREFYPDDIILVTDFFSKELLYNKYPGGRAKVVTSIAMFYDLEDPSAFVRGIKDILHPDGIWVSEQSYMPHIIHSNMFDTICHEHLEYYGLKQLIWLIEQNGLRVFDVRFNDVNGGSIQIWVCHKSAKHTTNNKMIEDVLDFEQQNGFDSVEPFNAFNNHINQLKKTLNDFISKEKQKGKTFHIYGASTKGNVLLQFYGIDSDLIDMAADRNPVKWGCHTPVSHIPIVSEEHSRNFKPDYYLVLPWHFRNEFVKRESKFLTDGGRFIFPLPEIEIIGGNNVRQL